MTKNSLWEDWNAGGGPKYPHEKVVQFCFRNFPKETRANVHALDLGCGGGVHTLFLATEGFQVTACDISENGVRNTLAGLHSRGLDAPVTVCPMEEIVYPPQSFDLVLCIAVLGAAGPAAAKAGLDRLPALCRPGAKGFFLFEANDDFHANGDDPLALHGYTRAEVEDLFLPRFPQVWIDEHTSTYKNGALFQKDWLVTVFF